jgi:hypothetical protein
VTRSGVAKTLALFAVLVASFAPPVPVATSLPLVRLEWLVGVLAWQVAGPALRRRMKGAARPFSRAAAVIGIGGGIGTAAHLFVGDIDLESLKFLLWPVVLLPAVWTGVAIGQDGDIRQLERRLWFVVVGSTAVAIAQLQNRFGVNEWLSPLYLGYAERVGQLTAIARGRAYGTVGNPNGFACFIVLVVLMACAARLVASSKLGSSRRMLAIVGLVTVFATLSRTGLLLGAIAAVLIAAQRRVLQSAASSASPVLRVAALGLFALGALVIGQKAYSVASSVDETVITTRLSFDSAFGDDSTLVGRTTKWSDALEGKSLGGAMAGWYGAFSGLDSEPLRFLLATGVVGLVGLALVWRAIWRAARSCGSARGLASGAVVAAVLFSTVAYFIGSYQLPFVLVSAVTGIRTSVAHKASLLEEARTSSTDRQAVIGASLT